MAVGTNAQTVGWYMGQTTAEGTHRVLGHDGKPSPGFVWPEATPRDETQREALEAEGVAFDEGGRADETRRVHTGDIRADLEANGVLTAPTRRAWLVREATTGNHDQVPDWFTEGHVALRASSLREVEAGLTRDELKAIVAEDYSSSAYSAKATKVDDLHAFLSRMQMGDLIATTRHSRLFVGTLTGEPEYAQATDGRARLTRTVAWATESGVAYDELPKALKARLNIQLDVVELSQQYRALAGLTSDEHSPVTIEDEPEPALALPDATPELAASLHVDMSWLQECVELLRDRPQMIFYGPPAPGRRSWPLHWPSTWPATTFDWCSSIRPTVTRTSSRVTAPTQAAASPCARGRSARPWTPPARTLPRPTS